MIANNPLYDCCEWVEPEIIDLYLNSIKLLLEWHLDAAARIQNYNRIPIT